MPFRDHAYDTAPAPQRGWLMVDMARDWTVLIPPAAQPPLAPQP